MDKSEIIAKLREISRDIEKESSYAEYKRVLKGKGLRPMDAIEKAERCNNMGKELRMWIWYKHDLEKVVNDNRKYLPDKGVVFDTNYNWNTFMGLIQSWIDELKTQVKIAPFNGNPNMTYPNK